MRTIEASGLALLLIIATATTGATTRGEARPTVPVVAAYSAPLLDFHNRQTLAQNPPTSFKCSSPVGLCILPEPLVVGSPCSCGRFGGVVIP